MGDGGSEAAYAGPLALVGGEEFQPGNEPQDTLLVQAAGEGPAFVLATAAARQGSEMAVRNAQRWFAGIGLRVSELPAIRRSDTRSPEWVAAARRGRFFYLVGGDPGIVPRTLAGTPLWETVTEAWRGGAALSGSSAGAMALCEWTLVRERVPGDARRRYKSALGIVPRVAVIPHFDSFGHRWVRSAISGLPQDDAVLLGIDERTAVVWTGGAWSRLGEGSVTVLRGGGGERFEDDTPIDGLPAPLFR